MPICEHMFGVVDELEEMTAKVVAGEQPVDVGQPRKVIDRLEYVWLRAVREEARAAEWTADFMSVCGWLRNECNLTPAAARSAVKLSRALEQLPATAEAFGAGEISRAHAEVIARAATPARADEIVELEGAIVNAARTANPAELRQVVQRVTDALDGDGGAMAANAKFDRRYLHASVTFEGMVALDGLLDPEQGEIVLSALDAVMEKNRARGDERSKPQQRADAFVELMQAGSARHAQGPGRRTRPNVSCVVDVELLEARGGRDLVQTMRGEAEHVGGLSKATLQRLTCDCAIARVITQGGSQPLDVGRSTRTIPNAIWRALVARDRGCVYHNCDRPPGWCEGHHIVHWENGGETNLSNLQLLCWRHHRAVHEGGRSPTPCGNPYEVE